jgi:hypothetical protein
MWPEIVWKKSVMRIIWRNSKRIAQNKVSIVYTGSSDEHGRAQRFY